ncbi:uncharacterized protein [Bemisia tabaci]|uniref:uncharacterized protein isoform X1 n=1 Tax=Bemisia tabaci TaxID=7038 RepID=UPI003B27E7B4
MALVPYTAGPSGSGGAEASGRRPSFLDMEFPRLLRRSLSRLIWSSGLQKSLSSFSSLFSPPPGYRCRVCRAVFHDLFSFESHLIYAHADEPAYLCKLCGDTFAVKRDLAVHLLRDHVDANSYDCSVCDDSFHSGRSLRRHMARHSRSGSKSYGCALCDAMFPDRAAEPPQAHAGAPVGRPRPGRVLHHQTHLQVRHLSGQVRGQRRPPSPHPHAPPPRAAQMPRL